MCAGKDATASRVRKRACSFCLPDRSRIGYNTEKADLSVVVEALFNASIYISARDVSVGNNNIFYECVKSMRRRGMEAQIPKCLDFDPKCDKITARISAISSSGNVSFRSARDF